MIMMTKLQFYLLFCLYLKLVSEGNNRRWTVFKNRVLRICIWGCIREGDMRMGKLYNDELNDSFCLSVHYLLLWWANQRE
jgi:hypothetical protein